MRDERIAEIISEFGELNAFARTRWSRSAAELGHGLRGVSMMVLHLIGRKGPISATEIGQFIDMDKAALSRHVAQLRDLGFIDTSCSMEDRRVQLLNVSELGLQQLKQMHEEASKSYRERFEGWDLEELSQLRDALHRFNAAADPAP